MLWRSSASRKNKSVFIVYSLIVLLTSTLLPAQGSSGPGEEILGTSSWRTIEGDAVPDYVIVSSFFSSAARIRGHNKQSYYEFAREFSFFPEARGRCCPIEILTRTVQDVQLVQRRRTIDERLLNDPVAFGEHQNQKIREKARALGEIYGRFLAELEEEGMPIASFMKTLDAHIRPNIAIVTDDDPGDIALLCDKDFYEGVSSQFSNLENVEP